MTNNIVNLSVSQTVAPAPNNLQRTGAFLSQGGSTLAKNGTQLLTQFSDLLPILNGSIAITSITWAAGVVTVSLPSRPD